MNVISICNKAQSLVSTLFLSLYVWYWLPGHTYGWRPVLSLKSGVTLNDVQYLVDQRDGRLHTWELEVATPTYTIWMCIDKSGVDEGLLYS
jgi:hypothetical protein